MTSKFLKAACLVSLSAMFASGPSVAQVVTPSPAGAPQVQAQVQPHSHVKEKIGTAPTDPGKAASMTKVKNPLHDHRSFHKHY